MVILVPRNNTVVAIFIASLKSPEKKHLVILYQKR